jgi:hypothetical protein
LIIREASGQDITAIVSLLKLSLGEALMPKSEAYWQWKHWDNPFGKSPVLLAFENNELIGVRAFMRWDWTRNGKTVKAVRAVDTATHPRHQGKGVFKNLTLSLLNEQKNSDSCFVFNTPNQSSKPGYIKMGWEAAGNLPVSFNVRRPFNMAARLLGWGGPPTTSTDDDSVPALLDRSDEVCALLKEHELRAPENIKTAITLDYLKWRYACVPVAKYLAITEGGKSLNAFVIARVKVSKAGRELRITELIEGKNCDREHLKNLIYMKAESLKVDLITMSGLSKLPGCWITLNRGPIVTVFDLNGYERFPELKNFRNWTPSLGDLELF